MQLAKRQSLKERDLFDVQHSDLSLVCRSSNPTRRLYLRLLRLHGAVDALTCCILNGGIVKTHYNFINTQKNVNYTEIFGHLFELQMVTSQRRGNQDVC